MAATDFRDLFIRYLDGKTSDSETRQILGQIAAGIEDQELNAWMAGYWEQLTRADEHYIATSGSPMLTKILSDASTGEDVNKTVQGRPARQVRFFRIWMGAAACAILLVLAVYLGTVNKKEMVATAEFPDKMDIAPGHDGAILTLANGKKVLLDTVQQGVVAMQGGTAARIINGQLLYQGEGSEMAYNTMSVPRGRQFHVTLADGTGIWLNSASSIRYPTAFGPRERRVEVTGEAYFEVAPDKLRPFRVTVNNKADIEVLGTSFNVNAYDNEPDLKTTLIEGSIKVSQLNRLSSGSPSPRILKPGQQARLVLDASSSQGIKVVSNADMEQVMAWKDGMFNFDGAGLEEVMRQLERWYDIDVVYEAGVPDMRFVGGMKKNIPLKNVLSILKKSEVSFRMAGERKLIVVP